MEYFISMVYKSKLLINVIEINKIEEKGVMIKEVSKQDYGQIQM